MAEMKSRRILVVDDEVKILEIIKAYLVKQQYDVYTATDGNQAIRVFEAVNPDLVILDLMLPGMMGEDVCQYIRRHSTIPILMLSAKSKEEDKLNGFRVGTDDYMTKPFSPKELVARVESLLRRSSGALPLFDVMQYRDGDLCVDMSSYKVTKQGAEVSLTQSEFKLLGVFVRHPKRVFTREELIQLALGDDYEGNDRVIDSHIKNLRNKIETNSSLPNYIITVHGIGYKFVGD